MNTHTPVYPSKAERTNSDRSKYATYDRPVLFIAPATTLWRPAPTAVTLFSGLGSSSKALRDLGYRVLAHDFMPEAVASLNANGFDAVQGDIRQVDFTSRLYREVEVLIGGPPCQPFSPAGRNKGSADARDMVPDFIRAVAEIGPKFFIMEQTRGLAGPRHRDYLELQVSNLEALGYVVEHRVLDAADHGVGQQRKRLFVLGMRLDLAADLRYSGATILWPRKRVRITMAEALGWNYSDCIARNIIAPQPAWDHEAAQWPRRRPSTTVVGSFRPEVQAAPGYRSAGDGPRQNAPGSVVTTLEERLVLQGLPADWKVVGSESKRALQVGNTCPTPLLRDLLRVNLGDGGSPRIVRR